MYQDFHTFLHSLPLDVLHGRAADDAAHSPLSKAGILPFLYENGRFTFCFMQPQAKRPELGLPPWQICKGTRMVMDEQHGIWRDMEKEEGAEVVAHRLQAEELGATALREGQEELGLIPRAIARLFDLGAFDFTSASTGKTKQLWLFGAMVPDADSSLLPMPLVAPTTAARRWYSADEFASLGRGDHVPIMRRSAMMLSSHLAQ